MINSLEHALEYAARGWAVFPLLPKSKAPATKRGFLDASSDVEILRGMWGQRLSHNIGVATGRKSGFWVLDIDSLDATGWLNQQGELPDTLRCRTSSGIHYYFRYDESKMAVRNSASRMHKNVDVRGDGGYVVLPPSVHPETGVIYEWINPGAEVLDAPDWIYDLLKKMAEKPGKVLTTLTHETHGDWETSEVEDMLRAVDPDCDYQTWVEIGMALHAGGWPMSMWDNWSQAGAKYKHGECARKWNGFSNEGGVTFGTVVYHAEMAGWRPKTREVVKLDFADVNGVDLTDFVKKINDKHIKRAEVAKMRPRAIILPALISETLKWIDDRSFRSQPELALMNIIAALGAVFGRRYELEGLGTRTNIYMVGIAESGMGKDSSRSAIKVLMSAAGIEQYLGPDEVRSGAGLMKELEQKPSLIIHYDEIGMAMKAMFDPRAPAYLREISAIFTKMYSSSDSVYIGGMIASKPDERVTIREPNLCLYGTTTLNSYAEAMKKSAISSGELNRFIVLKPKNLFPEPRFDVSKVPPSEALIERWKQFIPKAMQANHNVTVAKPTEVKVGVCGDMIKDLLRLQDAQMKISVTTGLNALWVRYRENILKIAMIMAIARDPNEPMLMPEDITTGQTLVTDSIEFMLQFAQNNMFDSEFEKNCLTFMQVLIDEGGTCERSTMLNMLRVKGKDLRDIETYLIDAGRILIRGTKPVIYEATTKP